MNVTPPITVLMPAYNAGKYIREAIESVLQQTFANFELVIVNDGSTDDTLKVISSFNDERIRVISQANMGVAQALNTGLKHSRGYYIARFDADDICYPHRLEKQISFLSANPDYIMVGGAADYILESGDFLFHCSCIAHTHDEIVAMLYLYCPFLHPTVMYRKESICNAGGYPAEAHNFEDYLLWTHIIKAGKLCNFREPLIKYRLNASSVTIDERWRGGRFREIKRNAIKRGSITTQEGKELLTILKSQDIPQIKEGAYHALCGKKFLGDNYQPEKARSHVKRSIGLQPFRWDNYLLYTISFLPEKLILWFHKRSPNRL